MKTFWKVLGGILIFFIILLVGIDLYFTSNRLKKTVLPYLNEAVGRPVQVQHMSLSIFKTFPHPGIEMDNVLLPGDAPADTLFAADRIVTGVALFPLLRNQLNITELVVDQPTVHYNINADSTTNFDFFLNQPADTTSESYNISIPYFEISNGRFSYDDATSHTAALLDDLDGDLSLSYADSIASTINIEVGGVSATIDSTNYLDGLPVSISEKSVTYPNREILRLTSGHFNIRKLKMDLSGTLSNWSKTMTADLQFKSSSNNFGELLRLLPASYASYTNDLKARGTLDMGGTINGVIGGDSPPKFNIHANVQDGYLKNPNLPQPIQHIQLAANATNEILKIDTLNATAGANTLRGSGQLTNPLENNRIFTAHFLTSVDLSTVQQFYDISKMQIEKMSGQLSINAQAGGSLDQLKKVTFDGRAALSNGMLKYTNVPKAFDHININAAGTQNLFTIKSMNLQAGPNTVAANGSIQHLLDENQRSIQNMHAKLQFNLSSLKDFYPMNEDSLRLGGQLNAQAVLDGRASHIEQAVQSGSVNLNNGLIDSKSYKAPFKNITLAAKLDGPKMNVTNARFTTGDNQMQATGVIENYLSDNRTVNLKIQGKGKLSELQNYYAMKPGIKKLAGDANFNLSVKGALEEPAKMNLAGKLTVKDVQMQGESLPQPVQKLNGTFSLAPNKATLKNLNFTMGASDFNLSGSLTHYMAYLQDQVKRQTTPQLNGTYRSKNLNLDELMDWNSSSSSFTPQLPDLNSSVTANIDQLTFMGVTMQNLHATAKTTPAEVHLIQAGIDLFSGHAKGTMDWHIPEGKPSDFHFQGSLSGLELQSFFKQYPILGSNSQFYKYITGKFNSKVDYQTKIDTNFNPLIPTTVLDGTFGMSKAQVQNQPIQKKLAQFTKIDALNDVTLDQWQSNISVKNSVLSIKDLKLSSGNIGLSMDGTQNLTSDKIDFHASLLLPDQFKSSIGSVIGSQALQTLTGSGQGLQLPLQIGGTYNNPSIQPDQSLIKKGVQQKLQNKAKKTFNKIFDKSDKKKTKSDSTKSNRKQQ